jgi:hypothetical protein
MAHLLSQLSLFNCIVNLAIAQSILPTSLIFGPWDARLSVITADATATAYLENNSLPYNTPPNCNIEAYDRATIINGPSTAGVTYLYTKCGTYLATIFEVDCTLTATDTATCTVTVSHNGTSDIFTETQNSSELSPQPCTITAGFEQLRPIPASITALVTSSAPGAELTKPGATSTTSPAIESE